MKIISNFYFKLTDNRTGSAGVLLCRARQEPPSQFFFQRTANFKEGSASPRRPEVSVFSRHVHTSMYDACTIVRRRSEDNICNILNLSLRVIKLFNESFIKAI